jgi:hypothetical protein
MECGKKFRTTKAAERAANDGCPGCGGVDIDIDVGNRKAGPIAYDESTNPSNGWRAPDRDEEE